MLKEAIIELQVQLYKYDNGFILDEKGRVLLKALGDVIQGRLWSSEDGKDERA
jgi:hypothetical protein